MGRSAHARTDPPRPGLLGKAYCAGDQPTEGNLYYSLFHKISLLFLVSAFFPLNKRGFRALPFTSASNGAAPSSRHRHDVPSGRDCDFPYDPLPSP